MAKKKTSEQKAIDFAAKFFKDDHAMLQSAKGVRYLVKLGYWNGYTAGRESVKRELRKGGK